MRFPLAAICLMATIFGFAANASAHIGYGGDFECVDSYETNCYLGGAKVDRRTMLMYFDGTNEENGARCERRTSLLQQELASALRGMNLPMDSVKITSIRYSKAPPLAEENQNRCSYTIKSNRRDLRFQAHHLNQRSWTNAEDRKGVCMDDVRTARAIPGAFGAAKSLSWTAVQWTTCHTNYATLGLDRAEITADGQTQLIKFGTEDVPDRDVKTSRSDRQDLGG